MATKALVTGNSRGLGSAIVVRLRERGVHVLGISRSGSDERSVRLDLSDPAALGEWLETGALRAFIDDADDIVLINNAGTVAPIGEVGEQGAASIAGAVSLNVTAPLALTDAVLATRRAGIPVRIVHVSSGAGRRPYPGWSVYCATKAALDMHAMAVAEEGHEGVLIESIAPGVVDTDMQAAIRGAEGFRLREQFVALKESGSLLRPDDAARAIMARLYSADFGARVLTDVRG